MKVRISIKYSLLILLSLVLLPVLGQMEESDSDSIIFRGVVMDINSEPISDVSLGILQDGFTPVLSDSTGQFQLLIPEGANWIVATSLDHSTKNIFIDGEQEITIYMTPNGMSSAHSDVNTGDITLPERDITGAVEHFSLDNDNYTKSENTLDEYLQGRVSGLQGITHSGMPGAGSYLNLRGMKSLFTNSQPLVLIDNIPLEFPGTLTSRISGNEVNSLSSINPLDISSITVLKDAATAAMYGITGSNGVILVSTLNPTATQTTVDFMFRTGLSLKPDKIPQLNNAQFKALSNELLASSNLFEEEYELKYPGLFLLPGQYAYQLYQHNTTWQEEIFGTKVMTEANLLVKGGDEISRYGLSVGYLNKGGNIKNTDFTRYNIRFTSFLKVYSWLEMNVNASLNNNNSSMMPSAIDSESNPILSSLSKSPLLSPFNYDDNGNVLQTTADISEFGISNPRAVVNSSKSENVNNRFITSINLKANIAKSLNWISLFGLNLNSMKEEIFRPENGMADYFNGLAYSYSEENNNRYNSIYTNHYLSYSNTINQVHRLSGSAGIRMQTNSFEHDWGRANNLPVNDEFSELQSGESTLRELGGFTEAWNRFASYAGANYMLKDKYALSANVSLDFSSLNGNDHPDLPSIGGAPLGIFYSIGAGWRVSNERFLRSLSWMDNMFIRASYGVTGNDDIGTVNALDYYLQDRYRETSGLIPGGMANTTLKHENSTQVNLGLDAGFLGDRYTFSIDYFRNNTSDLFFYEPQLAFIGYTARPMNGGMIRNSGIELSVFTRLYNGPALKWDIMANFTMLKNEVAELKNDIITSFEGGEFVTREGAEAACFYGYDYLGVYATQSQADADSLLNDRGLAYGAGDAIYRDISGPDGEADGIINDYDKTILGSSLPTAFGNLSNRIQYKNLSLDLTIYFVMGNKVFNYVRYQNEKMTDLHNQSIKTLQRWQREGDITEVPRALWNDPIGNSDFSSRWIEDGSFIRLKDITMSYRIPRQLLMFKDALFFVSVKNIITLTNYLGYDPDFSYSYNPMEQGIDYGMMPQTKQFMMGVKLGL